MKKTAKTVCLVSPFPPPCGGMAIQAEKLVCLLRKNGFNVIEVKTNCTFSERIAFLSTVPGLRTVINVALFLKNLYRAFPHIDVVYFLTGFFNYFFWITYPGLILIKLHGKRVLLSARGGAAEEFFQKYGRLIKPVLRRVDAITTPSGFLQDVLREALGMEPVVIPNIVDLTRFRFYERHYFRPRLLVARSLEQIYNVGCVIKAFKIVHNQFPQARLGIAGAGSQREELQAVVAKLGLNNCVTFYGEVQHKKIHEVYEKYDIFMNASEVDNLPGTFLEAFASGLPVISTRAGGIPYIVEDGVTGLLVDVGDCEALAEKVIQLVGQPELGSSLARNARNECQNYSWQHVRTLLLPLLKSTMKK